MLRLPQCITVLAMWCMVGIIISPIYATGNATNSTNTNATNHTATTNNSAADSEAVVYTYSEATVKDGKPSVSQLTIAKGKDSKLHFAKTENGTTRTGIWEGPLPSTPDVSQLVSDISDIAKDMANPLADLNKVSDISDITKVMENPLADLSKGIGSSLQDYLQNSSLF